MKTLPLACSLFAVAVCAGCAKDQSDTAAMGASGSGTASNEPTLYCKDGAHVSKSVGCAAGVERDMTPPAAGTTR